MEWLERVGGNVKEVIDGFVFERERERERVMRGEWHALELEWNGELREGNRMRDFIKGP